MATRAILFLTLLPLLLTGCQNPAPRSWLRFEPTEAGQWTREADGRLRAGCGPTVVRIDLDKRETRIEMAVENQGTATVQVRAGAQGASPTGAIGEVWRRPLSGGGGEEVPDSVPYLSRQDLELRPRWRAIFYLDSPLGRELVLGQYLVFQIEVQAEGSDAVDRLSLPLVATNAGGSSSSRRE